MSWYHKVSKHIRKVFAGKKKLFYLRNNPKKEKEKNQTQLLLSDLHRPKASFLETVFSPQCLLKARIVPTPFIPEEMRCKTILKPITLWDSYPTPSHNEGEDTSHVRRLFQKTVTYVMRYPCRKLKWLLVIQRIEGKLSPDDHANQ